jgi:starch-binding outer membrane protein, SusD/RagB family
MIIRKGKYTLQKAGLSLNKQFKGVGWLFLAVGLAAQTGCKKWLDVAPKDKVPQQVLFSNEQGFKDALSGVYLGMDKSISGGSTGLYTNHLSMGLLSVLAYAYDNGNAAGVGGNGTLYNAAYNYNYNDAVLNAEITNIWKGLYNNIANINNILTEIDANKSLFSGSNYALVKGEALGLRALMHFDVLRMFGESPATGGTTPAIPYVTNLSILLTPLTPVNETAELCLNDLRAARALLATTDTSAVLKGTSDPFRSYTQNHFNYWAVQGLMARVFLYKGNTDSANHYAQSVIGSNKFPLITNDVAFAGNITRDRTYSREHLFALYSANLVSTNNAIFNTTIPLQLGFSNRAALYGTPSADQTDWRFRSWFDENPGRTVVPSKFYQDNNLPYDLQGLMPVLRVSEMYYIASECTAEKNDIPGATFFLNKVRAARGLSALNAAGIPGKDSINNAIMREYKKEFISEGQTFFYYKRLNKNLTQASGTPATLPTNVYVFPMPDLEKEYRNG